MAMQIGGATAGAGPEQMMAHITGFDHAGLVRDLHGRGFDPVEAGGDLVMFMPHAYALPAIERLAALKAETGVEDTVISRSGRWNRPRCCRPSASGRCRR